VQRRVEVYEALADRYRQIGAAAGTLADDATRLSDDPAGAAGRATPEVLGALQGFDGRIAELQQTARGLATDAREQGFEDLGRQAHALDQTLSSLRNKLNLAQRAAAPAGGRHTSEN
jgi:uncharacterized protein YukE